MTGPFDKALAQLQPVDADAARAAMAHQARLTKPAGALGRLENLGAQLAGIGASMPPPRPHPAAVAVFAGDHGVLAQGVTPWPKEVTGQMVANFVAGGAAINVLARQIGATVTVVDVGVDDDLRAAPGLRALKVARGTADLAVQPAMAAAEVRAALDAGASVAAELVDAGAACLVTGDMGIGNTTPSAALIAAFTGRPAEDVTGRGTGIDDETLARKIAAVRAGVARLAPGAPPLEVAAEVGGLEIVAIAGFVVAGAAARVPVVVDGVIALAGTCLAAALAPDAIGYCVAGHRSTEPGASIALAHLGLEPVLDLGLRLGEGTGACLAVPVIEAAARILDEMATFDAAGVTQK
jgi:nicotinate-nucleotide--dimethylbenzimidazole phosphoribosyltransferase